MDEGSLQCGIIGGECMSGGGAKPQPARHLAPNCSREFQSAAVFVSGVCVCATPPPCRREVMDREKETVLLLQVESLS